MAFYQREKSNGKLASFMGTIPLTVTFMSDFSCIASPLRTGRLGVVEVGRGTSFTHNPGTRS